MIFCIQLTFDLFLRLRSNYRLGIHPYVFCHISRNNISMGRIMYSILPSKVKISLFSNGIANYDGPDIKLFILVGLGRSFFVCCLAHRGSTVGFLLLQCSSGVFRRPGDLWVSVATCFCLVLIFASS